MHKGDTVNLAHLWPTILTVYLVDPRGQLTTPSPSETWENNLEPIYALCHKYDSSEKINRNTQDIYHWLLLVWFSSYCNEINLTSSEHSLAFISELAMQTFSVLPLDHVYRSSCCSAVHLCTPAELMVKATCTLHRLRRSIATVEVCTYIVRYDQPLTDNSPFLQWWKEC